MKRLFLGLVCVLFLLSSSAQAQFHEVLLAWTSDGNPTMPVCSSSVKASCKNGYDVSVEAPGATSMTVLQSGLAITLLTATVTPIPQPAGNYTYGVAVTGLDNNGSAIIGNYATVVVAIPFNVNPPGGLTGVLASLDTLTKSIVQPGNMEQSL